MKRIASLNIVAASFLLLSCLVLAGITSCVPPQKVQEKKKETVQNCMDCHAEFKTKFIQGIIHAPVKAENCYSCHRPHGLYGKIIFRSQQPELCYSCHDGIRPQESSKSVHEPVHKGNCTVCHSPHNSDFPGLLKAEGDASCYECHDQEEFRRQRVHQPVKDGCATCHNPHAAENGRLLIKDADSTCTSCHDVAAATFSTVHFTYPVSSGCIFCHTPHSSSASGLLKKNVHVPVLKGQCDACHSVDSGGKIKLKGQADTLCLSCHEIRDQGNSVHQPYVQGQCTTCHDVHASNFQNLFSLAPEKVCLQCHDQAQQPKQEKDQEATEGEGKKESPGKILSTHKPFTEGKCLDCHRGHISDNKAMLSERLEVLCYKCHDKNNYAGSSGSHPAGAGMNCETCHVPHNSIEKSLLIGPAQKDLCYGCHKMVSSERGKFSLHKPFLKGECGACHQLHRPALAKNYLSKSFDTGELCLTCHDKVGSGVENYKSHDPVTKGQCRKCHAPHAADNEFVMLLPPGEQCYICHQDVKKTIDGSKMQHQPVEQGNCTGCHSAHGSVQQGILKKSQPALCVACHLDVAKNWLDGFPHKPALKSCLQCHGSHGADLANLLVKPSGSLCVECHDVKTSEFSTRHGGITPQPESCASCHDPHGSTVKSMLYPVVHSPFGEGTCTPCHTGGKN